MKYIKICFIIFLLSLVSDQLVAQASSGTPKSWKMMLPDGRMLGPGGLDSLERIWGKGRIRFKHNEEDDEKGIMHVVQITDEMWQEIQIQEKKNKEALSAMLNKPAPTFELKDHTGRAWSLAALQGKVVVLNFWFTACAACISEMPELNKLTQVYTPKDVVFLALTFNNADQTRKFLQQHTFNYTLLTDSHAVDEMYNIRSWPTSIVIDKEGKLKTIIQSNENIREELRKVIDGLM